MKFGCQIMCVWRGGSIVLREAAFCIVMPMMLLDYVTEREGGTACCMFVPRVCVRERGRTFCMFVPLLDCVTVCTEEAELLDYVTEREREGGTACCMFVPMMLLECGCVCVCVCERERERWPSVYLCL